MATPLGDDWDEVTHSGQQLAALHDRLATVEHKLDQLVDHRRVVEAYMKEILCHVRQHAIVNRIAMPLGRVTDETDFARARATNMALRQGVPFPLAKARSGAS